MDTDIKPSDLTGLNTSEQKELMKQWFLANYEDPAERTPYESAAGGYIWIWGGPYDAREEIEGYFFEFSDESTIEESVNELEYYCLEWAPTERPGDYDDYVIDDISSITEAHKNLTGAIQEIEKLLESTIAAEVECNFYRLLFVNVITALETFLSDAFISKVMGNREYFKAFVKSSPDFKKQKFLLSDVLEVSEAIESTVKTHLLEVVWHNLDKVSKMYLATLGVKFPDNLGDIYRAILKRHDIVHRNGKNKDGEEILIEKADIAVFIKKIEQLAQAVDFNLAEIDF